MSFNKIPYPSTYSIIGLGSPTYLASKQGQMDLVEVSLINEINDGEVNYPNDPVAFQTQFEALYNETLGNTGVTWSQQITKWQAGLLNPMGVGTEPPAPAGTYNK